MGKVRSTPDAEGVVILLGACLLLAASAEPASGVVLTVDASCRLGDAIEAANKDLAVGGCPAGSGADEIHLADDVVLTAADTGGPGGGLPWIESELTLQGFGHTILRDDGASETAGILRLGQGALLALYAVALEIGRPAVGGGIEGASGSSALCAELSTRQRVSIRLDGESSWDCVGAGLEVRSGNTVVQRLSAQAEASEVGGWTTGLVDLEIRCKNDTTGEGVRFLPADSVTPWSCSANGLAVTPGDALRIRMSGTVE